MRMQPPSGRAVRKRSWRDRRARARACVCHVCGADVFPLPLRVSPAMHIRRAYVRGVTTTDGRTGKPRHYAILFCPACADPDDVRDYDQLEIVSTHDAAAHAARIAATRATGAAQQ